MATASAAKKAGAAKWEAARFVAMAEYFDEAMKLAEFDSDVIGQSRARRLTGGKEHSPASSSTVLRESDLLRNLFTLAVNEWRWLDRNPFLWVRLPKHNPAPRSGRGR